MGNFRFGENNQEAFDNAHYVIAFLLGKSFTHAEFHQRVRKLCRRHHVFARIISRSGVVYEAETNRMHIPADVWPEIVRDGRFARAYHTFGEPQWENLQIMFGRFADEGALNAPVNAPALPFGHNLRSDANAFNDIPPWGEAAVDNDFWGYVANYDPDED